jgi:hypothetical protein
VAEQEDRYTFEVAYFREDPSDHTMNAAELGDALLGFARIFEAANYQLNGQRAQVSVLVKSEFEHKCFSISFEVVLKILSQMKDILDGDRFENVSTILKHLGVIVVGTGTLVGGVLGYLKWKKGRKEVSVEPGSSPDTVAVRVRGDNNTIIVNKNVYELSTKESVKDAVQWILDPVDSRAGRSIRFKANGSEQTLQKTEVKAIMHSLSNQEIEEEDEEDDEKRRITATLYVYSPVFDSKAPKWRFLHNRKPIYVDVSETSIAKDAIKRGGSFLNDRYRVVMEVTAPTTDDGAPTYRIVEVLEFNQAEQQSSLALKKSRKQRGNRPTKKKA